jgi:hypothetical protein
LPDAYDLREISVSNLYEPNSQTTESGTTIYNGYYMGQVVIDFNEGTYSDFFSETNKNLISRREGKYFYNYSPYSYDTNDRAYIIDEDLNFSTVEGIVNVTRKNKLGSITGTAWYSVIDSYYFKYNDNSIFEDLTTDSITLDYYFIIDSIEELRISSDWNLYIPSFSGLGSAAIFEINLINDDLWKLQGTGDNPTVTDAMFNTTYQDYNPIYAHNGIINLGTSSANSDVYSLNIDIEKKFDDTTENFFDGAIHDYYSLDFDSYKYGVLTEEAFSVVLQISSAHNWYLYLDNEENPSSSEKVGYELYLKYRPNSSYSQMLVQDSQDKILIKNIKSSSASSTIYLQTKSDQARVDSTTKGEYQDTVYLNFITDGWSDSNESSFAEKIITLQ